MKKKVFKLYQLIVVLSGVGIPVYLALRTKFLLPPVQEYTVYFAVALISSYLGIIIGETIISFEISIYYFLLLTFGPIIACLTAISVELLIWLSKAFARLKVEGKSQFLNALRIGFYNSGVYGLLYLVVGIIYFTLVRNVGEWIGMIAGVLSLVIINELLLSVYNITSGNNYLKYLKSEGLRTDLMEIAIYPFGISMYFLYNSNGFLETIPIVIGILLLSILGKAISNYQERLIKSLEDISRLNRISRNLSSILQLNNLMDMVLKDIHNIAKPKSCSIYIKSVYDEKEYYLSYDGEIVKEKDPDEIEERGGNTIIPLESGNKELGYIELETDRELGEDEIAIIQNVADQASVSLSNAMLYMISIRDPLTDLYTRRHFESRLKEEVSRADRTGQSFSLIMFDVDELKNINDNYGHKIGDEVLKRFAGTTNNYSRPFDVSARWGGDEFILILPKTSESQALEIGKRIEKKFSGEMYVEKDERINLACSYAVEEYEAGSEIGAEEIFYRVDHKLIETKKKTD